MIDAQSCLENAERCILLAEKAPDADAKSTMIEMAEAWMKIAEDLLKSNAAGAPRH